MTIHNSIEHCIVFMNYWDVSGWCPLELLNQSVISKSHIYPLTPLLHTCSATCYFRFSAICANGNEKVRSADAGSQENIQSVCLRLTNITGNEPGLPSNHVPTCARVRLTKSLNRPQPRTCNDPPSSDVYHTMHALPIASVAKWI